MGYSSTLCPPQLGSAGCSVCGVTNAYCRLSSCRVPYQQMTNIFLSKKETGSTMLKILNHSKCRFQNVICRLMHCSKAVKYTSWCKLQLELLRLTVTVPPNIANMVIKYLCRDQLSKLSLPSNNEKKNCPCVSRHRGYE